MLPTYPDLSYGPDPAQRLDLYRPTRTPAPVVLFLHGGGWAHGDKFPSPAAAGLVAAGFAVAAANYRLTTAARFPAQLDDARAAVAWLRSHAAQYNLDPARVGAFGVSAGGHLAALLGVAGEVDAVCDWFGPTDLSRFADDARAAGLAPKPQWPLLILALLGGTVEQRPDLVRQADPTRQVSPRSCPFLIQHGDRDEWVPLGQSRRLADALAAAGVRHTFAVVRGGGHGPGFDAAPVGAAVVEFFRRTLR